MAEGNVVSGAATAWQTADKGTSIPLCSSSLPLVTPDASKVWEEWTQHTFGHKQVCEGFDLDVPTPSCR